MNSNFFYITFFISPFSASTLNIHIRTVTYCILWKIFSETNKYKGFKKLGFFFVFLRDIVFPHKRVVISHNKFLIEVGNKGNFLLHI